MPKNVMKLLKPSPHRARNDFDLSHRHVFSINFGELLPSTCIETVPGDHIELHQSDLIRAIPMVTSPFLRAKQHTDVWFVPYRDLWHNFNNFVTKKDEPVSSALGDFNYVPYGALADLWADYSGVVDIVGQDYIKGRRKLLNLLGYGNGAPWSAQSRNPSVNLFRLAAYNYIWYNEYRQQYYDDGRYLFSNIDNNAARIFNFDYLICSNLSNSKVAKGVLKIMAQMRYRCWKKDLFTGLLPSAQFGAVSTVDIIGQGSEVRVSFTSPITGTGSVVGQTGAAQFTGWDDGMWQYDNSLVSDMTSISDIAKPGEGAYTQHLGSLLAQGKIGSNDPDYYKYVHQHSIPQLPVTGTASISGSATGTGTATVTGGGSFDVLALRKSEAIQIWRENALRAGNRVKDNMMAHYGVESDFKDHRPVFLGSVSSPLSIGDVMTTANSSEGVNNAVGDIAGKGLSSIDEKVFKFDAKDFGVIMAITSILPEAEYNASGISRPNQLLDSEDFFVPEYENLGLEPVSSYTFLFNHMAENVPIGYAPRYWAYKTKLDKCYGSFMTNGIYSPWCSPKYDVDAVLSSTPTTLPLSVLYVNPKIFDVNFSVGVDQQDQFLCDVYFDVDAVRPMSVTGLPFS